VKIKQIIILVEVLNIIIFQIVELVETVMQKAGIDNYQVVKEIDGKDLEGVKCKHPFLDRISTFEKNKISHNDKNTHSRITDAVENALKNSPLHEVIVLINDKEYKYSEAHACKKCGFSIPEMEPRLFSFNSPIGACPNCKGLGITFEGDENKMIPHPELSIIDGGIEYYKNTAGTTNIE